MSQREARSSKKRENEELIDSNIRLREYHKSITQKLNTVKDDYTQDKLDRLKDFEIFCKETQEKRDKLLRELSGIQALVESTKENYYALIVKQDQLDEKVYKIQEEHKKLDLREIFVRDLEEKWKNKQ